MEEKDELLANSKCKDCEHLISRIIIPMDYEDFGIDIKQLKSDIEEEEEEPLDKNEEIAIVHNTCVVLNMDLGHLVVECNRYSKKTQTIFRTEPWKK